MSIDYNIDKSWIDAGLDLSLIEEVMNTISSKRLSTQILLKQDEILNALKLTPFSKC